MPLGLLGVVYAGDLAILDATPPPLDLAALLPAPTPATTMQIPRESAAGLHDYFEPGGP
ncbi:MAG: hypothetical protein WC989_07640 [Micavibrio sp.]